MTNENHGLHVRAREVLRARKLWIAPILIAAVFAALMTAVYIGSVINPTGHLHNLPVLLVDDDQGANVHGQTIDVGRSLVSALEGSANVTNRLALKTSSLQHAQTVMNRGGAFAALIIPPTLTRSVLLAADVSTPGSAPPASATVTLQENARAGNLGVNLAAGVITPAIAQISPKIGAQLSPLATKPARANPVLAAHITDPVTLATSTYRPLPDHTALGLSAFYIALLGLVAGFVAATLINSSIDSALGYSATQLGPRFTQRRPVAINRRRTLLVKLAILAAAAPVLTGIVLLVAAGLLGMNAPNVLLLWGLLALAALMIGSGTLALLAAFGSIGQLLAMLLLVYLSLASAGGTVPVQALPGFIRAVGNVEPLRNTLAGTRSILYFGAQGDAGLIRALAVLAGELVFWLLIGLWVSTLYDRRSLDRIAPDVLDFVNSTVDRAIAEQKGVS